MQTIGLIGGMSWESTVTYYSVINTVIKEQLGGFSSARCVLYSVDFREIERCQSEGRWDESAAILGDAALALERAGADFFLICTNTMHKVADAVAARVSIPLVHIAEETGRALLDRNMTTVGLLGTAYTMEQDFYTGKLAAMGITALVPEAPARRDINSIIFDELCLGVIKDESRRVFVQAMQALADQGAQAIVFGCTEIGLLVSQADSPLPVFDTAHIHARRAALRAIG